MSGLLVLSPELPLLSTHTLLVLAIPCNNELPAKHLTEPDPLSEVLHTVSTFMEAAVTCPSVRDAGNKNALSSSPALLAML